MIPYNGNTGFYCCSYLTNKSKRKLVTFLKAIKIRPHILYPFHSTIMFSKICPTKIELDETEIICSAFKFDLLGDSLVLLITSNDLNNRHNKWKSFGCKSDYDDYVPHVTIIEDFINIYSTIDQESILIKLLSLKFNIDFNLGKENIFSLLP